MKDKAKRIIRNILISALASMYGAHAQSRDIDVSLMIDDLDNDDKKDVVRALKQKAFNNVLKVTENGDTKLIAAHRSHRSHMSHRSSRGSSHTSHTSHSSSSYVPSESKSQSVVTPKPASKTYKNYTLGDRTLSLGLYGNDVSVLIPVLINKKYYQSSWIVMKDGYPLYDARVVDAVKRFQKDAGLVQDGQFTAALVDKLQHWDEKKTTIILGIRSLSFVPDEPLSGTDVEELIALLKAAGFPPDPLKLQKDSMGRPVFTEDVEIAVKLFQSYNGLEPNGEVNDDTLQKLQSFVK